MTPKNLLISAAVCGALFLSSVAWAGPKVRLSTSVGDIDIELDDKKAPLTTAHVLALVDDGFYDGLIFHRVLANFVVQTGGYTADGSYREPPGTVVNESNNGLSNRKGSVAMARLAHPDSADAQFYINVKDNNHLDATPESPGYTVFGKVIAGWDAVVDIELADVGMHDGLAGYPTTPIIVHKAQRLP